MTSKSNKQNDQRLSPYAQIVANIGPKTEKATTLLVRTISDMNLLKPQDLFPIIAPTMESDWSDSEASSVISAINKQLKSGNTIDPLMLERWIQIHQGDAGSVEDCMSAESPEGFDILRVLSRKGSQKLVFLANWQIAQREVVIKKFVGSDAENRIRQRESQAHPLSMSHPNIIETHILQNSKGEFFLVERRLPLVLYDEWRSNGVQEAANLLRDMASALSFLSEQQLVHGDIKPDNIGYESNRYILLDFGICRSQGEFAADVTPTGSLRTRAPELLMDEEPHSALSDVWALGATVFNALTGRFPLFDENEKPPRISKPSRRVDFEEILRNRIQYEWERRIDLSSIPETIRPLLERALERNPRSRVNAHDLVQQAEHDLAAMLRFRGEFSNISLSEEIDQLNKYLPDKSILVYLSQSQIRDLQSKIEDLRTSKGLSQDELNKLALVESRLP